MVKHLGLSAKGHRFVLSIEVKTFLEIKHHAWLNTLNSAAVSTELLKIKGDVKKPVGTFNTLAVTTLRVYQLHLSVLLPREWWGKRFLNHSNIEVVLNKQQPGESPRKTNQPK